MSLKDLTIAFIGLGKIGSGIAKNVQASGCRFAVYNRTPEKTQPFAAAGARVARSAREAATSADIVITCLMDDKSVLDMLSGEDGILAGLPKGAIHVGTSTISPVATARIAMMHKEHGSHYVAAPVLGRPDAAAAGRLILTFVAGERESIERVRPVLETYTQRILDLGEDHSRAASMKLAANFFAASLLEIIGEAFAFAEKQGVLAPMKEMLKGFLPMGEYTDRIADRRFDQPGFTLDAGLKDVRLILEAAGNAHVPLPFASVIRDKCLAAQARGFGQQDWSVFTEISRLEAGQPPR